MARLDRLGDAKDVTQIGAAIGREFSHALLAAVASKPEAELASALDRLIAAGLLFRQGVPPHAIYLFKHSLVQDAAYGTLLREPRRALHARIADALETSFAGAIEPELIAHHLTEAGRIEHATDYWLKAGQRAMKQSAHVEAERHLRAGLKLLSGLPDTAARHDREINLQNTLGVCLMPTRGFGNPEVTAAFTRAAEISARVGNVPGLFIALRGNGQYHMISGDLRTAANDAHRVLALAQEVGDRDFLVEAHISPGARSGPREIFAAHSSMPMRLSRGMSANATITSLTPIPATIQDHAPAPINRFRWACSATPTSRWHGAATCLRWPKRSRIPSPLVSHCGSRVACMSCAANQMPSVSSVSE